MPARAGPFRDLRAQSPRHFVYNARRFDLPRDPAMSACQTPLIVALDFPTRDAALKLADQLDPALCRVKVGKELFTSSASGIVETLCAKGFEVFLDLSSTTSPTPRPWR